MVTHVGYDSDRDNLPPIRARTGGRGSWIAAIGPGAFEALIFRRMQDAAGIARGPAGNLVGRAAFVAAAFPALRPGSIGSGGPALLLVPEKDLALAIALHAQGHRGEGRRAQLGGAERLAIVPAHAGQEVFPQRLRG